MRPYIDQRGGGGNDLFGHWPCLVPEQRTPSRRVKTHQTTAPEPVTLDLFDFLCRPILPATSVDSVAEEPIPATLTGEQAPEQTEPDLPTPATWGKAWVTDQNGFEWSVEGVAHLQRILLERSCDILGWTDNVKEKIDVLRWIFSPPTRYVYHVGPIGELIVSRVHALDEPFSFLCCARAAGMNPDKLRDGIERNVPAKLLERIKSTSM